MALKFQSDVDMSFSSSSQSLVVVLLWVPLCASFTPIAYSVGTNSSSTGLQTYSGQGVTLDSSNPVLTLDYGTEVAGFPYVQVTSVSGSEAQIELKYTEAFSGLANAYGDGPWLYTSGNMNSFRTETFNISGSTLTESSELFNVSSSGGSGMTESFFLQGGQRWQSVTLLSNDSITISAIGFRPSVTVLPVSSLTGAFSASDDSLDEIWNLGSRAVQVACVDANTQPSTWELSDNGALVRGQYPVTSALGEDYDSYTLTFFTKIVRGGTGWRVAGGANGGYGAYFVLTSNATQLLNANTNLTAPNSLTAGYGFSIINQAILPSAPIQQFPLPMELSENEWYSISTVLTSTGYNVSINGTVAAFVPSAPFQSYLSPGGWGTASLTTGTWGFGPWLDQAAYFKNVEIIAQNGTSVYTNSLTTQEVFEEYGVAANSQTVCLDGAKRDREIWIGDYAHTSRMIAASSGRYDILQSMLQYEFEWQFLSGAGYGFVPIQETMGAGQQYESVYYPSEYGESDYQIFFLVTIGDYFTLTSDTTLMSQYWNGTKLLVDTIISSWLDPYSGLLAGSGTNWFTAQGTTNATAPTALFATALKQLISIAIALDDASTAATYTSLLSNISTAINTQLWSPSTGAYAISLTNPTETGILATAFTIRSGIANATQAASSIAALTPLFCEIGYMDNSGTACSGGTQLSPNTQGFLLDALFLANRELNVSAAIIVPVIQNLLGSFWPSMVTQNEYYTGTSWEYVFADGSPGIGLFTSLCHCWGGAPTYVLTDYVLGVRREFNETTSAYGWVFDPAWDIVEGMNLTAAQGKVPLVGGGYIDANWTIVDGAVAYNVDVVGATGVVVNVVDPNP